MGTVQARAVFLGVYRALVALFSTLTPCEACMSGLARECFVSVWSQVSVGPGLIASLWGVFVFGEIKGTRNFAILGTAFAISITSSILIAMSH
jgi:hypothetical protein